MNSLLIKQSINRQQTELKSNEIQTLPHTKDRAVQLIKQSINRKQTKSKAVETLTSTKHKHW